MSYPEPPDFGEKNPEWEDDNELEDDELEEET